MLTRLDHLVILVGDLDLASSDYERLGFAVTPGGEHPNGATGIVRLEISAPNVGEAAASLALLLESDTGPSVRLGVCLLSSVATEKEDVASGPLAVELVSEARE